MQSTQSLDLANPEHRAMLNATPDDIRRWRDSAFGLFIHWGPVSLKGVDIGWSRMEPADYAQTHESRYPEKPMTDNLGFGHEGCIPPEEYDNLYRQFNPVDFDADACVRLAQEAGMQYIIPITKHHDGFCMFDSQLTDYKITAPECPFGRDVTRELAEACHRAGMKLGLYYSQADFHHPDFLTQNHDRYIQYLHGQIRELLTRYGRIEVMWFDGLLGATEDWNSLVTKEYDSIELVRMMRELQPHIMINNRNGLPGDFTTPEQEIGVFRTDRPWESCITIGTIWAWKPQDPVKPLKECVQALVSCACGNGNLLLNVGPGPTGRIEPLQAERLREIGAWLRVHGESIYGVRGGPFLLGKRGGSTHKDKTVWLHLFDRECRTLALPDPDRSIQRISHPQYGTLAYSHWEDKIAFTLPDAWMDEIDTVLRIELDRPASTIPPTELALPITPRPTNRAIPKSP
jgi:alpha-L-fucosidase